MSHMVSAQAIVTPEGLAKLKSMFHREPDPRAAHVREQVKAWTEVHNLNPEDRTVLRKLEFWERELLKYSLE